jgi:type II secretory ATPase GspE/PulE/Tfp pilus assembly ATPase PilB-like protein
MSVLNDRVAVAGEGWVTVGFLDGQTQHAHMTRFTPYAPDLSIALGVSGTALAAKPTRMLVPAERVAFIAFHKRASDGRSRPAADDRASLKVHVAGGATFLVEPPPPSAHDAVGFYAVTWDATDPYRELFFYAHGVNAKEINQPIGAMLIEDGALDSAAIARAMEAQASQKRTPIGQILVENKTIDEQDLEQAMSLQKRRNLRLGEVLVEAGLARPEDIEFALAEQKRRGGRRIGEILVGLNLVSEVALTKTLAKKFQLPFIDLDNHPVNLKALAELPKNFIEKYRVLPIETDPDALTVALSDPLAVQVIDALRTQAKKKTREVVATPTQLEKYIPLYLDMIESEALTEEMDELLKELVDDDKRSAEADPELAGGAGISDSTIVKLVNQIILDAYRRGASDIHIEPNGREHSVSVRFRVDGECATYKELPSQHRAPLVARVKIMASLDISERRKPQDGKVRLRFGDRKIELRVATIPTVNDSEDVVMRILASSRLLSLSEMGLAHRNLEVFRTLIARPYGLVLCVGPTGSGKTTTLHSGLGAINTVDMKIWTAEDPVEITQPRLRQVQVNPKIGFTFANAMRAFLRADPDVIMVGEMRDLETASIAVEASLTGHLVLSTLHTNSAPETVVRLVDMGLDPFSFADALLGVLAQRLARALCRQCREPFIGTREQYDELAAAYGEDAFATKLGVILGPGFRLWRARGCPACSGSGYKGRIALHELLVADDAIKVAIQHKQSAEKLRELSIQAGMTTLLQDGIEKVLAGLTDLKQVLAVCSR